MGKTRIIAETGAGSHGVAIATACALLGLDCYRLHGHRGHAPAGAQRPARWAARHDACVPVDAGRAHAEGGVSAPRSATGSPTSPTTHYAIGLVRGPGAASRALVRDLQRIIGDEAARRSSRRPAALPSRVIACVGGGSNAIGTFVPFLDDAGVELDRRRGGGEGIDSGRHGAPLDSRRARRRPPRRLQRDHAGRGRPDPRGALDQRRAWTIPGTGPEHAYLRDTGRATTWAVTDDEALARVQAPGRARGDHPGAADPPAVASFSGRE